MFKKFIKQAVALSVFAIAVHAHSMPIVLDFEGGGDLAMIQDFYNGGTDSQGNMGVDYGISFSGDTLSIIDSDAGGSGNFANEPTGDTIMFFLDSTSAILNIAAGFDTGFSFFYSSSTTATVSIWSGLNATGTLLETIDVAAQFDVGCVGDPNGAFCNWTPVGVAFAGTAMSIDFGGTANFTGYDDITFGSVDPGTTPVPEPGTLALLGIGLLGLGAKRRYF